MVLLYGFPGVGKTASVNDILKIWGLTIENVTLETLRPASGNSNNNRDCAIQLTNIFKKVCDRSSYSARSLILFDEIDRMIDTEKGKSASALLSTLGGLEAPKNSKFVLVLFTANKPWALGDAFRDRLNQQLYLHLPNIEQCKKAFEELCHVDKVQLNIQEDVWKDINLKNFSYRNITNMCKETRDNAWMRNTESLTVDEMERGLAPVEHIIDLDLIEAAQTIKPRFDVVDLAEMVKYSGVDINISDEYWQNDENMLAGKSDPIGVRICVFVLCVSFIAIILYFVIGMYL